MSSTISSSEFDRQFNTKKKIEKDSFIWTIEKFSSCELKKDERMRSPLFNSKINETMKWRLDMYPKGDYNVNEDYISLWLILENIDCIELTVLCSFYVLGENGEKKYRKVMNIKRFCEINKLCVCHQFLEFDLLHNDDKKLLSNDNLILGCEIFYYCGPISTISPSTNNNTNDSMNLLLLYHQKFFHSILAEKQYELIPNIIEINGFSPDVVEEMTNYLYTGKSPNMDEIACEMLEIGEKYGLERLKLMAEESLLYNLSTENACNYLICSELYSGEILKEWCLRFIYLNAENIVNTEEWKEVVSNYPLLIAKLFNIAVNID
uniref:MATH domain-containing protein n=1 Tax=Strongyloides papillosus TaxID=174720 RepID=A0A0N5BD92_STREA